MSSKSNSQMPAKTSESSRRRIKWGVIILVAIVALFGVYELGRYVNKWGDPDELRVIKAEKMVEDDLLGLELVETRISGQGSLISKTVSPNVERFFKVDEGDMDATQDKLIKLAEEDGWVHDPSIITRAWIGRKTVKGLNLTISIRPVIDNSNLIEVSIF